MEREPACGRLKTRCGSRTAGFICLQTFRARSDFKFSVGNSLESVGIHTDAMSLDTGIGCENRALSLPIRISSNVR